MKYSTKDVFISKIKETQFLVASILPTNWFSFLTFFFFFCHCRIAKEDVGLPGPADKDNQPLSAWAGVNR